MYKLIMLPNQPILVSDEKITEGCYVNRAGKDDNFLALYTKEHPEHLKDCKKIIATVYPFPNTPSIDFSALSPKEHATIGYIDVVNLAIKNGCDIKDISGYSFIKGFKTAQSLNEKKFSLDDIIKTIELARETTRWHGGGGLVLSEPVEEYVHTTKQIIQSISQPKVFDVEVEMEDYNFKVKDVRNTLPTTPKITNNLIKIIKVL